MHFSPLSLFLVCIGPFLTTRFTSSSSITAFYTRSNWLRRLNLSPSKIDTEQWTESRGIFHSQGRLTNKIQPVVLRRLIEFQVQSTRFTSLASANRIYWKYLTMMTIDFSNSIIFSENWFNLITRIRERLNSKQSYCWKVVTFFANLYSFFNFIICNEYS